MLDEFSAIIGEKKLHSFSQFLYVIGLFLHPTIRGWNILFKGFSKTILMPENLWEVHHYKITNFPITLKTKIQSTII